jgi:DNA-binding transcriptional ArsR family regulator
MAAAGVVFQVLADPTRRRMIERLRDGEHSVGELISEVGASQPGVSRHLRILRDAGIVQVRAEGQRRLYSLRSRPFQDLDRWMEDYRHLVNARLDRLEAILDAEKLEPRASRPSPKGRSRK